MSQWGDWRTGGTTVRPHELPLFLLLPNGEQIRIFCLASDLWSDIKSVAWQAGGLNDSIRDFIVRLPNAEAYFPDEDTLGSMLPQFMLFREPGFAEALRVTICEKKDTGDVLKRSSRCLSAQGCVRAHGPLQKRGTSGVHKWQQRYFALQDNTLFNFGSQEEFERRMPASECVPMGSCLIQTESSRKRRETETPQNKAPSKSISEGIKKVGEVKSFELSSKKVNLDLPSRQPRGGSESFYGSRQPTLTMFCLQAASVGKREFWLRTKDETTYNDWINSILSVNMQRAKRIVLDVTREASLRGNLVKPPKDDSKEAEKLMAGYAYGLFPRLTNVEDSVLAELFTGAMRLLSGPLWPATVSCGLELEELKVALRSLSLSARAFVEHIVRFLHSLLPHGLSVAQIVDLGAPLLFEKQNEGKKLLGGLLEHVSRLWPALETTCKDLIVELPQPRPKVAREAQANKVIAQIELLATQKEDLKKALALVTDEKQKLALELQLAECRRLLAQMVATHIGTIQEPEPILPRRSFLQRVMGTTSPPTSPLLTAEFVMKDPPLIGATTLQIAAPLLEPRPKVAEPMHPKSRKTIDTRSNRLCFPLHFQLHKVVVRVVEELQAIDGRPFTPGRFYCFDDLISENLGNRVGCTLQEVLPAHLASYAVSYEYGGPSVPSGLTPTSSSSQTSFFPASPYVAPSAFSPSVLSTPPAVASSSDDLSQMQSPRVLAASPSARLSSRIPPPPPPSYAAATASPIPISSSSSPTTSNTMFFVPEPVCLAYLGQCNLLTPLFQLANYLANRPSVQYRRATGDSAWEPMVVERERRKTIHATVGSILPSPSNRKRTLGANEFRRRTSSQHLARHLDADDFVDIDTAAPPLARVEEWMGLSASTSLQSANTSPQSANASLQSIAETKISTADTTLDATPIPMDTSPSLGSEEANESTSESKVSNSDTLKSKVSDIDGLESKGIEPGTSKSKVSESLESTIIVSKVSDSDIVESKVSDSKDPGALKSLSPEPQSPPKLLVSVSSQDGSDIDAEWNESRGRSLAVNKQIVQSPSNEADKIIRPIRFEINSEFEHVMRYQASRACFLQFLKTEHAQENLLFWDDVRLFLQADSVSQYDMARRIYATYLAPDALEPVNVRGMNAQVSEALSSAHDRSDAVTQCSFLFLEAQLSVVRLLKFGSFARFTESAIWEKFVTDFHKREWVRMKVVKMSKLQKNEIRVLEFDSDTFTITFYKADHTGAFAKVDVIIPASNLMNVQLSVDNPKKLKISFFKNDQRQLRNQKEWRVVFRTTSERERLARLITGNLVLRRTRSDEVRSSRYQPTPLVIEKEVKEYIKYHLPLWEAAAALHETWMTTKHREGWTAGEVFREDERIDPELVPFPQLSKQQQESDLEVASLTMGSIIELGYKISPQDFELEPQVTDLEEDSRLLLLVEFLSENAHDCWAANKIKNGWKHGKVRSEEHKTHPNLVHYVDLDEADKDWNRHTAQTVLKTLLERGFRIEVPESNTS